MRPADTRLPRAPRIAEWFCQAGWRATVTARADSAVWRVLEVVARQPALTGASLSAQLGPSVNVHRALDAFARRAGRRG